MPSHIFDRPPWGYDTFEGTYDPIKLALVAEDGTRFLSNITCRGYIATTLLTNGLVWIPASWSNTECLALCFCYINTFAYLQAPLTAFPKWAQFSPLSYFNINQAPTYEVWLNVSGPGLDHTLPPPYDWCSSADYTARCYPAPPLLQLCCLLPSIIPKLSTYLCLVISSAAPSSATLHRPHPRGRR